MNYELEEMTPKELELIIEFLQKILGIKLIDKKTISTVIKQEKDGLVCPNCSSHNIIKYGFSKTKIQRYKCKDCNDYFNSTTNTVCYHSKIAFDKWKIFFECMADKLSIRKTAAKMQVNKNTVFAMRHKVLKALEIFRENVKIAGQVEADEISIPINFKGMPQSKIPRFSKKRKSASKKVNHRVCILGAIDEYDNEFLEIVGNGELTSEEVKKSLGVKMNNITLLITDCKSSYEAFAKENNIGLEQIKSKTYKNNNGYTLSEINGLHSNFFGFLSSFKGVSTKHLQGYIDWFVYKKYIDYTYEVIKHPEKMLYYVLKQNSSIIIKDIYNKPFPFDINEAYIDYTSPTSI